MTVVGEVKGATTKPLDEGEYQYPVLDKQLVDWNEVRTQERDTYYDSPYAGRYGGYYGPGHRGITALAVLSRALWLLSLFLLWTLLRTILWVSRGYSVPAPAPPPASSIPPQFKKTRPMKRATVASQLQRYRHKRNFGRRRNPPDIPARSVRPPAPCTSCRNMPPHVCTMIFGWNSTAH